VDAFEGLFGAIGEFFGGVAGAVGEGAGEAVVGGIVGAATGDDDVAGDASATYERYLVGAPRALNVNDL
jgi:hypothetical protein